MSWNYRVVKNDDYYSVHEVFYNSNNEIWSMTESPIDITAETVEDIKSMVKQILKDIDRHPVIELPIQFAKPDWEANE